MSSCLVETRTFHLWDIAEFSLPSGPVEAHSVSTYDGAPAADLLSFIVGCCDQLLIPGSDDGPERQPEWVSIPLRESRRWTAVSPDLQRLFRPPSGQGVRFQFFPTAETPHSHIRSFGLRGVNCVVLFQPSLTCVAGVVQLVEAGRVPLLVVDRPLFSSSSAGTRAVLDVLISHYPRIACVALSNGGSSSGLGSYGLPLSALLAALMAEVLGVSQVTVFEETSASAGLFEWFAPSLRPIPSERALSALNALLLRLGFNCSFTNAFAAMSAFDVAGELPLAGFTTEELRRIVLAATDACCGKCPQCLVQHIVLKTMCDLDVSDSGLLEDPRAAHPDDLGDLLHFLSCVIDFDHMSDAALVGLFPDLFSGRDTTLERRITACRRAAAQIRASLTSHFPSLSYLL